MATETKSVKIDMVKIIQQTVDVEKSMRDAVKYITGQNALIYYLKTSTSKIRLDRPYEYNALQWQYAVDVVVKTILDVNKQTPEELMTAITAWPL